MLLHVEGATWAKPALTQIAVKVRQQQSELTRSKNDRPLAREMTSRSSRLTLPVALECLADELLEAVLGVVDR